MRNRENNLPKRNYIFTPLNEMNIEKMNIINKLLHALYSSKVKKFLFKILCSERLILYNYDV